MIRSVRRALVPAAAGLVVLTAAAPASATPAATASPRTVTAAIGASAAEQAQTPLVRVANQLKDAVATGAWPGFAGIALQPGTKAVLLYGKGAAPAALTAPSAAGADAHVTVVPVPYSLAELEAEARRVAQQHPKTVVSAGPRSDFTGLQVTVNAAVPGARAAVSSAMPVTVTTGKPVAPAVRWDDVPAFWGGGAMRRPAGGGFVYCTTGFAAQTSDNRAVMITAQHCGTNVDWTTGSGALNLGRTGAGSTALDANLIFGSAYEQSIYVGDINSNSGVPIFGATNPALNSFVFASGSFSGAGVIQVTGVNQFINLETNHVASVGQGDSGGPVAQSDGSAVRAAGIIDAVDLNAQAACVGIQYDGRECAWHAFHINITNIMVNFGLRIGNTGGT
jgi:streptogrisin D